MCTNRKAMSAGSTCERRAIPVFGLQVRRYSPNRRIKGTQPSKMVRRVSVVCRQNVSVIGVSATVFLACVVRSAHSTQFLFFRNQPHISQGTRSLLGKFLPVRCWEFETLTRFHEHTGFFHFTVASGHVFFYPSFLLRRCS